MAENKFDRIKIAEELAPKQSKEELRVWFNEIDEELHILAKQSEIVFKAWLKKVNG
jgi:hypothetical protein